MGRVFLLKCNPLTCPSLATEQFALAIDTTSPILRLGRENAAGDCHHEAWTVGRDLSLYLHQYLATFIPPYHWSGLAWLAVAKGPGSYTGTRVGVVTARTLAQQLDVPLYGISTLAMYAWVNLKAAEPGTQIAVQMPGQRGHVHGGIYELSCDRTLKTVSCDRHVSHTEWATIQTQYNPEQQLVIPDKQIEHETLSQALLTLSRQQEHSSWQSVRPHYG